MNPAVDLLSVFTAPWLADVVGALVRDPDTQALVTYVQEGAVTISATTGTATVALVSQTIPAWRGVPVENAVGQDSGTRQYLILQSDLPGIAPAKGDFIRDAGVEYGIDRVDAAEVGGTVVHYLLSVTLRSP